VSYLKKVRVILFDLHGTLVYEKITNEFEEISDYLFCRGFEVSPQQFGAASSFVSLIDYPKYGYRTWHTYLARVFHRLELKVDDETLNHIIQLETRNPYILYSDAVEALTKAKRHGFKTAVVTTIAHFKFDGAICPIRNYFDLMMTGYEAGVDKSHPKMYLKVLEILHCKASEAIMVGDEMSLDFLLPKRLGINAVLLDREGENKEFPVDTVVSNLNEAIDFVLTRFTDECR
jgi:putative hydrolase of the HAD superfamily